MAMHPTLDVHCTLHVEPSSDHDGDHSNGIETWPRQPRERYRFLESFITADGEVIDMPWPATLDAGA